MCDDGSMARAKAVWMGLVLLLAELIEVVLDVDEVDSLILK